MLEIMLCEDDHKQRKQLEEVISTFLREVALDMTLTMSTPDPQELLDYVSERGEIHGLYFLDMDLQHELNGIDLAVKIREMDTKAKIVFITTHDELAGLVFKHKIEAMDYIIKGEPDVKTRVKECLNVAFERYQSQFSSRVEYYSINTGEQISNIPITEILFFETDLSARHRIILHTTDSRIYFRGFINEIADAHVDFFLCHKSVVVNTKNIKSIDKTSKEILMINGETAPIATRKLPILTKLLSS